MNLRELRFSAIKAGRGIVNRTIRRGNKRIKLVFRFAGHEVARDAEGIKPLLRDFDPHVVCLESLSTTRESARAIEEEHAAGKLRLESEHATTLHKLIREHSRARVFLLERYSYRDSQRVERWHKESSDSANAAGELFLAGHSREALNAYTKAICTVVKSDAFREKHVNKTISNLHKVLTCRFPELKKEKEIRVAVNFGSAHTPLYKHAVKRGFASVGRVMSSYYFAAPHALARNATFGLRRKFNREEIAKALLASLFTIYASNLGTSEGNANAFGNILARRFSLEEFHRISSGALDASTYFGNDDQRVFQEALASEGIALPNSREEVHDFLKKRGIPLVEE